MVVARYVYAFLQTNFMHYVDYCPPVLFLQDNALPRIARRTVDFFHDTGVNVFPLPPRSSNLNPTRPELIDDVQVAWKKVPQAKIDHLILSIPRYVQECTKLQGCQTHCYFLLDYMLMKFPANFIVLLYVTLTHCQKIKLSKFLLLGENLLMFLV